jgi:hypothetical protein
MNDERSVRGEGLHQPAHPADIEAKIPDRCETALQFVAPRSLRSSPRGVTPTICRSLSDGSAERAYEAAHFQMGSSSTEDGTVETVSFDIDGTAVMPIPRARKRGTIG